MWFKWNSVLNYRSASIVVIGVAFFVATILVHADQQHSLSFGIDPYLPKSKLINKFLPLDHYRSEALEVPLNIEIVRDNEALIERLGRDRLDIAYMTPASYVEMPRRYGKHRLLARISVNGSPTYRGVIVIRADSPFKELSQLIHKRFAFGRVSSTISYRVPHRMLQDAGVTLDMLLEYSFLETSRDVALGVLVGDFDAGAIDKAFYSEFSSRGLQILDESPEIPESVFVASNRLNKGAVVRLRHAMYALSNSKSGKRILQNIKKTVTGLSPAWDNGYDALRRLLSHS